VCSSQRLTRSQTKPRYPFFSARSGFIRTGQPKRPGTVGGSWSGPDARLRMRVWLRLPHVGAPLRSVHGLPRRESAAPRRGVGAGCQDCMNTGRAGCPPLVSLWFVGWLKLVPLTMLFPCTVWGGYIEIWNVQRKIELREVTLRFLKRRCCIPNMPRALLVPHLYTTVSRLLDAPFTVNERKWVNN
jgi:hypothetical protein